MEMCSNFFYYTEIKYLQSIVDKKATTLRHIVFVMKSVLYAYALTGVADDVMVWERNDESYITGNATALSSLKYILLKITSIPITSFHTVVEPAEIFKKTSL
ncbi:hypothetical protein J6590_050187 [Homalodisca vitripennis]|nr:hypothetical protein J6590_050187 [Homalodisca vitripennis]